MLIKGLLNRKISLRTVRNLTMKREDAGKVSLYPQSSQNTCRQVLNARPCVLYSIGNSVQFGKHKSQLCVAGYSLMALSNDLTSRASVQKLVHLHLLLDLEFPEENRNEAEYKSKRTEEKFRVRGSIQSSNSAILVF